MNNKGTKKITTDKNYQRPNKTFQESLSNQDIKEKLKEYKKVDNIKTVSIGTHIRYFTIFSYSIYFFWINFFITIVRSKIQCYRHSYYVSGKVSL